MWLVPTNGDTMKILTIGAYTCQNLGVYTLLTFYYAPK